MAKWIRDEYTMNINVMSTYRPQLAIIGENKFQMSINIYGDFSLK